MTDGRKTCDVRGEAEPVGDNRGDTWRDSLSPVYVWSMWLATSLNHKALHSLAYLSARIISMAIYVWHEWLCDPRKRRKGSSG